MKPVCVFVFGKMHTQRVRIKKSTEGIFKSPTTTNMRIAEKLGGLICYLQPTTKSYLIMDEFPAILYNSMLNASTPTTGSALPQIIK